MRLLQISQRVKTKVSVLSRKSFTRMPYFSRSSFPNPLSIANELAPTTNMRAVRSASCIGEWPERQPDHRGQPYVRPQNGSHYAKEPKTAGSQRIIPLTGFINRALAAMRIDKQNISKAMGIKFGAPYTLGTIEEDAKSYRLDLLSMEHTALCKMNGFECTFHALRRTFTAFMIDSDVNVLAVEATSITLARA